MLLRLRPVAFIIQLVDSIHVDFGCVVGVGSVLGQVDFSLRVSPFLRERLSERSWLLSLVRWWLQVKIFNTGRQEIFLIHPEPDLDRLRQIEGRLLVIFVAFGSQIRVVEIALYI